MNLVDYNNPDLVIYCDLNVCRWNSRAGLQKCRREPITAQLLITHARTHTHTRAHTHTETTWKHECVEVEKWSCSNTQHWQLILILDPHPYVRGY